MKIKNLIYRTGMLFLLGTAVLINGCFVVDPVGSDWNDEGDYTLSKKQEDVLNVDTQQNLIVQGVNGKICITGTQDVSRVTVRADRKIKSKSREDAEQRLQDLQVVITENESEIIIQTEQPAQSNGRTYSIDYQIEIPQDWEISVTNVNGEVFIDSVRNSIDLYLTNGNVHVRNHSGDLQNHIINGNMSIESVLPEQGSWRLSITNGQLSVSLPAATSAELNAVVTNGIISTQNLELSGATVTRNRTSGRLNEGAGEINLSVVNGLIQIMGND